MFSLIITRTGQPAISRDFSGIDAYHSHKNDGVRLTVKPYGGTIDTREDLADVARAHAPAGTRIRLVKDGVMVRYPLAMVKAHKAIESDWQAWAAAGMTHGEMQRRGINHPIFRAFAG